MEPSQETRKSPWRVQINPPVFILSGVLTLVIVGLGIYTIAARPAISVEDVRPAVETSGAEQPDQLLENLPEAKLPCCQNHAEPATE